VGSIQVGVRTEDAEGTEGVFETGFNGFYAIFFMSAISDVFELADEVGVIRSGWAGEMLEVRVMAGVLLELSGEWGLVGDDRALCDGVLEDRVLKVREVEAVRELYARREREALLAGVKWEGGGL
jgi:hypothetical protein